MLCTRTPEPHPGLTSPQSAPSNLKHNNKNKKSHSYLMTTDLGAGRHEVQYDVHSLQGGEFLSFPLLLLPPHPLAAITPNILPPSLPFSAQTPHNLLSLLSSLESRSVYATPRQSRTLSPNERSPRHSALSYSRAVDLARRRLAHPAPKRGDGSKPNRCPCSSRWPRPPNPRGFRPSSTILR